MILEITEENFESIFHQNSKPVILDFWSPACGPCKLIAPYLEQLAEEYKDQVVIGTVNTNEQLALTQKFGVRNVPTVYFTKNGETMDKQVGSTSKSRLEEKILSCI